jgi:hypothetical protein
MANLLRVSIQGSMPGGEKWSVNPCFGLLAPGVVIDADTAQAIAVAVGGVTYPATLTGFNVAGVSLDGYRVEARNWDGTLESVGEFAFGVVGPGSGSSNVLPYQNSMVVSLKTARAGASGKGRLYWPVTSAALTASTLRASSSTVGTFLNAFKTYLGGIEDAVQSIPATAAARLIVWSRTQAAGYYVEQLEAGDIMDVQRRRRDSLVENYTSTTFP